MNKIFIAPLFTMLVVSCGIILPSSEGSITSVNSSQDESSLNSQTTSSTNPSSNEEPFSNRKVPFNQIGTLVAQVVDAKAMGVVNSKDRVQPSGRRNAQGEDQNYMVKVTETYNIETKVTEEQTVQITLVRVTNTQTTELQTGTESYIATAEPITIERLTDLPGNIMITNVQGYEFRLLSEGVVVQDWIRSELETIEFIFDEALTGITLESRSLNASISFIAFEGFTYTITQDETIIYEDLIDNDDADNNDTLGNITLSGLTEGLTYDVTYEGYQVIETITQDEVEGQVDKLYVLFQYTFISFVPLNVNDRPQDKDLELDYDGVPLYDKQGYFSDSTRQSFVVDNNTGLIYKIENINIASLSGGCVAVQDSPFPYDMRITELGNLEFYSLHQNSAIVLDQEFIFPTQQKVLMCFKDKFGNNYVKNSRLNQYDASTKTFYYVHNYYGHNEGFNKPISYWLTSKGEAFKISHIISGIASYSIMQENQDSRPLNVTDNFKIYRSVLLDAQYDEVKDGKVYTFLNGGNGFNNSFNQITFRRYDPFENVFHIFEFQGLKYNIDYFYEHKIFLIYSSNSRNLSFVTNIYESFDLTEDYSLNTWTDFGQNFTQYYKDYKNQEIPQFMNPRLVLEDCDLLDNEILRFGISANTYYEIILENTSEGYVFVAYEKGTYIAPPSTTITLQPINR
jgi:hypothetical protein